jgi:putative flippase GtrA
MTSKVGPERRRKAFLRFGLSGIVFTILGPGLFWLCYPLGPFVAVGIAESVTHVIRFTTFKLFVFPEKKGYRVSLSRYVISALPVSITGIFTVALLRDRLDRTMLTLVGTFIAVIVGFVWSRYIYSRPVSFLDK